jgi:hypothetical protein
MQSRNGHVPMEARRTALDAVKTKSILLHERKQNSAQFNRAVRRSCTVKALMGRSRIPAGYKWALLLAHRDYEARNRASWSLYCN